MTTIHLDDKILVQRMLAGQDPAFEEFFGHYFPSLYRFALTRLGGDADLAEEIVQASLCRAISKLVTYRGEAPLFSWLCTFCRREISATAPRRRAAYPLIEDLPEVRAALESLIAAEGDGPEARLEAREVARFVQAVLDRLPRRYGQVLTWKYMQDRSVREIAARLGVGPKAAESLLTRARRAFRDSLNAARDLGPGRLGLAEEASP
ncbi:MAG: sigma-70 family RNA polymerase sigma factor [Acidobacteriota bacterium]